MNEMPSVSKMGPQSPLLFYSPAFKVDFGDLRESYSVFADMPCTYLCKSWDPSMVQDRIAILKLGWQSLQDCLCSIPVAEVSIPGRNSVALFPAELLRESIKDFGAYYQFCYVSSKANVQGISPPFQFIGNNTEHRHRSPAELLAMLDFKTNEIVKLQDENEVLRESVKILISKNNDKASLERKIEDLRNKQDEQQKEIGELRIQLDKMEMKTLAQQGLSNFDDVDPLPPCPISFD